jgi:hypothetical protein
MVVLDYSKQHPINSLYSFMSLHSYLVTHDSATNSAMPAGTMMNMYRYSVLRVSCFVFGRSRARILAQRSGILTVFSCGLSQSLQVNAKIEPYY